MRLKRLIYSILYLLLVTGCKEQKDVTDTLNCAEAIMESTPDSAYALIQTLDSGAMKRRSTRARYALLYTQAQDKNYIDGTNDSIITVAVDYYRHHGDVHHRFLSLYYKGRIHSNAGDYLHAIQAYSEAEGLVPGVSDAYYCGLLYSQLGIVYKHYMDYPKSLEAYQKAYRYYNKANKKQHQAYALWTQANVCWHMNELDECKRLYSSVLTEADYLQDTTLKWIALGELFMVYMEQDSIAKAHTLYNILDENYREQRGSAKFQSVVAEYHAQMGNCKKAELCMRQAWNLASSVQDSVSLYFTESRLYDLLGNHQKAYQSLSKGTQMQTLRIHDVLQHPVLSIQLDYMAQELAFANYRRKMEKILWFLFVVTLIVLVGVVMIRFWKVMKRKNESIRYYLDELAGMKMAMVNESSEKSRQLQELFREHFKVVDMLGESFSQITDEKRHQKDVYKKVKLLLDNYDKDNKSYFQLEQFVNRYNGNVMQLLREEIEFPENTYRQLCYHMAGFSVSVVSLFMKEAASTLYKRRSRALDKIAKSDAVHKEKYCKMLSK